METLSNFVIISYFDLSSRVGVRGARGGGMRAGLQESMRLSISSTSEYSVSCVGIRPGWGRYACGLREIVSLSSPPFFQKDFGKNEVEWCRPFWKRISLPHSPIIDTRTHDTQTEAIGGSIRKAGMAGGGGRATSAAVAAALALALTLLLLALLPGAGHFNFHLPHTWILSSSGVTEPVRARDVHGVARSRAAVATQRTQPIRRWSPPPPADRVPAAAVESRERRDNAATATSATTTSSALSYASSAQPRDGTGGGDERHRDASSDDGDVRAARRRIEEDMKKEEEEKMQEEEEVKRKKEGMEKEKEKEEKRKEKEAKEEAAAAAAARHGFAPGAVVSATFATFELQDFLHNWLTHAAAVDLPNVFVIALDAKVAAWCAQRGVRTAAPLQHLYNNWLS
jgi:hypothetical protein